MPELPEVETIRRDLTTRILGRKITSVNILSPKTASHSAAFFKKALLDRQAKEIERRGKLLIFVLSPFKKKSLFTDLKKKSIVPDYLLIHLKMTGQLIYVDRKEKIAGGHSLSSKNDFAASVGGALPNKHTRAIINFAGGGQLFFNDLRKFGYLKLVTKEELETIIKNNYGPEPLTSDFTLAVLVSALKNKKINVKALLLNQKLIAGLGNIYADEALWAARINPERPAGSLKSEEIKRLREAINQVIKLAIKHRGTTFSNYVDSRGQKGNFYSFLKVYGRKNEKCPRCGEMILKRRTAGRGTHYCPNCQK